LNGNGLAIKGRELSFLGEVVKDLLQGSLAAGILFDWELTLSLDAFKQGMKVSNRRLEFSSSSLDVSIIAFQTNQSAGGADFSGQSQENVLHDVR
jgi:hypothetical protein